VNEQLCMEDGTHWIWTPQGGEVIEEPCLHSLPCPKHSMKVYEEEA